MKRIETTDACGTQRLGQAIGRVLEPPSAVLLTGDLGAGKTVLARGIFEALGVDPTVVRSPTFSLVNEYPSAAGPVYHVDLYRLETPADFHSIPLEDILAEPTVTVVEWAERLPFSVSHAIHIQITGADSSRTFEFDPELSGIEAFSPEDPS